jgi:hypothetical protein
VFDRAPTLKNNFRTAAPLWSSFTVDVRSRKVFGTTLNFRHPMTSGSHVSARAVGIGLNMAVIQLRPAG